MRKIFLCASILSAALGVVAQQRTPDEECSDRGGDSFCGNCQAVYECDDAELLTTLGCPTGHACKETGGDAICVPEDTAGQCYCSGKSQCDPFDSNYLMLCNPDGGLMVPPINCETTGQTCYLGECTSNAPTPPPSPCADKANSWTAIYPACTSYAFCNSATTTSIKYDCPAGTYYDEVNVKDCTAVPPNPCTGCEGTCSDPYDCSNYHTCQGGKITSSYKCAGDDTFDYAARECVKTNEKCDPRIECEIGSGGTTPIGDVTNSPGDGTTPSTSDCNEDTVYQMWPDPANCKMYYKCYPTASGGYYMGHDECPNELVFNPTIAKCDLQSNYPECQV